MEDLKNAIQDKKLLEITSHIRSDNERLQQFISYIDMYNLEYFIDTYKINDKVIRELKSSDRMCSFILDVE